MAAQARVYQTAKPTVPSSPMASINGPALKTVGTAKPLSLPGYMIPKKTVPVGVSFSSKSSSKKHKHRSSKKGDRKLSSKSGNKKPNHSKKPKKSSKSKKYYSSSVSSVSESEVSENEEQKQV